MELKEYYKIIRANMSVVIYTILIFVVATYAWSVRKSETWSASMLLNVSRAETQNTADYRFDQFYRLQADEKFCDTVSEWLKAPGVAAEILGKAGLGGDKETLRQLSKSFRAQKVSPQTVEVTYAAANESGAQKTGDAIGAVVEENVKGLNADARDPNWFAVKPSDFIVRKNTQDLRLNLALAILAGIFAGAFFALGKHYISETN